MILGIINYIISLALALWLLLFYHNYAVFIVFITIVCYPIFSGFIAFFLAKKISINLDIVQKSVSKNHDINLEIGIKNKTFFSHDNIEVKLKVYNAFYDNDEIITVYVPATARETRKIIWKFKSAYCGRIVVKLVSVKIRDFSGIFRFACKADALTDIIVMPENKIIEKKVDIISEGDGTEEQTQNRKGSDVSEISDIREYIPGDKQQMIHWKISAKKGKLMVKEAGMPYTNELMLVPELYYDGENATKLDETIDVLFSCSYDYLKEGRIFYVGYLNSNTGEVFSRRIESEEDLEAIIKQMFYNTASKDSDYSYRYFKGIGKYEGKSIVYVKEAVITCL